MNNKPSIGGFLFGLLSSATFGLIPLFTIPVMREGMGFHSVLIYRFAFACAMLFALLLKERKSLRINLGEAARLMVLALLYDSSALFLFWGYTYMASGVATTIHFMYPVMTSLLMFLFFRERTSLWTFGAIVLAISGVIFLTQGKGDGEDMSMIGLIVVLISAFGYALYLITVNQFKVRQMGSLKLTFYVFLFGTFFLWIYAQMMGGIEPISSWNVSYNLLLLALIPTVISNVALIHAVKRIGSTLTSVMGALEPLTAVCVGIFFLSEPFSMATGIGIGLIVAAVTILVLKK